MNPDDISGEMIIALKTGLMGPIAGIGDTLIWGTLKPICLALATTMALSNNLIGHSSYCYSISRLFYWLVYV